MPADKTIVPDAVKSASILATEANAVKAKLAAAEYEIKALYEHIATLYQAHHVGIAAFAGFVVGAIFGIIV